MSSGSVQVPPGEGVAPLNFIYACSVCCYSFADVYQGHNKTVKGFSDGINPKERIVTHLYLGSCCHVFCSSHIEGGGKCAALCCDAESDVKQDLHFTPMDSDRKRRVQCVSRRRATASLEISTLSAAFRRMSTTQ
jgi:hypothetical protein